MEIKGKSYLFLEADFERKLEGIRLMVKMFASVFFSRSITKPEAFKASDS